MSFKILELKLTEKLNKTTDSYDQRDESFEEGLMLFFWVKPFPILRKAVDFVHDFSTHIIFKIHPGKNTSYSGVKNF